MQFCKTTLAGIFCAQKVVKYACLILYIIIYMEKFLSSGWLRAVQFIVNTIVKIGNTMQKKRNTVQYILENCALDLLVRERSDPRANHDTMFRRRES